MVKLTELIHDFKQIIKKLREHDLRNVSDLLDPTMVAGNPDLRFNRLQY